MSGLAILRVLLLAAEAVAASTALPVLAWGASLAFGKRANLRHLIRVAMFAGLLVLPPLALLTPTLLTVHHQAAAEPAHALTLATPPAPSAEGRGSVLDGGAVLVGLLALWGLGVAGVAGRSLVAALGLADLRRRAVLHEPAERPDIGRPWELRLSGLFQGPMTWGVLRPVVLLPWDAIHWPEARMQAVLAHELAHVRRRDCLAQAIATAACALYWPNPLVWLAARALRRDAEIAADDAVIASGVRPSDYAEVLVSLARALRGPRLALAMANPSALAERVQSILSPTPVRTGVTVMDAFKIIGAGAVATAALALARPGVAETPAPAVSASSAPASAAVQQRLADPAPLPKAAPAPKTAVVRPKATVKTGEDGPPDAAQIAAEVRQAIADAHIGETVAQALAAEQGKANAEVARQMAVLQPRIQKAIADAHIEDRVARQLADLQPRIDAAMAKAQAQAEKARQAAEKARPQTETKPIGEFRIGVDPIG